MRRLHIAVAECSYREVDRQLKEQFIHGLNDKTMLNKVIRDLTAKDNNEQTTSEDVLVWAKRIEAQWAQAAIYLLTRCSTRQLPRVLLWSRLLVGKKSIHYYTPKQKSP